MHTGDETAAATILAVGDVVADYADALRFPEGDKICHVGFADVTPEKLIALLPVMVVSPLVANGFDCLDLALRLQMIGYRGKFRVLAPDVTRPAMIRSEITAQAPDLDVEILTVLPGQPKRVV